MEVCFRGYESSNLKEQAFEARLKIVDKLLEAGADPNYTKEATNMTPLHWAAYNGDRQTCRHLIQNGANVFVFGFNEQLPIDVAGYTPQYHVVDTLLEAYCTQNGVQIVNTQTEIDSKRIQQLVYVQNYEDQLTLEAGWEQQQ